MERPLNILVIGTGMYVCGRGTDGYGTVMPAILEWRRRNGSGKIYVAGKSRKGMDIARAKINALKRAADIDILIKYLTPKEAVKRIPRPGACIVVVPDNAHSVVAKSAIEAGLHTLVVKPLAPTVREVNELISLQKRNKVYCAVEFHKRFDEANLLLKDVMSGSRIGDPLYFVVEYSQRKSVPSERFVKWAKETNVFQYLGIHYVDIIYFATGATPVRVMATGQKGWLASRGIDTYDAVQAAIEWKMPSGKRFTSQILTNWIDPESTSAMSDQKIKVIGTKGRFESDQKNRGITIVTDGKGVEEPNPYFCASYGPAGSAHYRGYGIDSIKQFLSDVSMIEGGEVNIEDLEADRPTFRQSIVPTTVLEGVNKSLESGARWVRIKAKA